MERVIDGVFTVYLDDNDHTLLHYTYFTRGNFTTISPANRCPDTPASHCKNAALFVKAPNIILASFEEKTGLRVIYYRSRSSNRDDMPYDFLDVVHRSPSQNDLICEERWWQYSNRKNEVER